MSGRADQHGLSLLEAVVAIGIASYAIVASFQAFSGGLSNLSRSGQAAARLSEGQAVMAEAALDYAALGATHGQFADGTAWRLEIMRYTADLTEDGEIETPASDRSFLVEFRLYAMDGGRKTLLLQTLQQRS